MIYLIHDGEVNASEQYTYTSEWKRIIKKWEARGWFKPKNTTVQFAPDVDSLDIDENGVNKIKGFGPCRIRRKAVGSRTLVINT